MQVNKSTTITISEVTSAVEEHAAVMKEVDTLLCKMLLVKFLELGILSEQPVDFETIKNKVKSRYFDWIEESLNQLERSGYVYKLDGSYVTSPDYIEKAADISHTWEANKHVWLNNQKLIAQINLVDACITALPDILVGNQFAVEIMFPESSLNVMEGIYKNNPIADFFNNMLANILVMYIEERIKLDKSAELTIVEIGAGTGGTTKPVLEKINKFNNNIKEYCYTDISKAFLVHGEKQFKQSYPYLIFENMDIENPLVGQNLKSGKYDIAIATNVLHATKNIDNTLFNVKSLLRKNGLLLLNELSGKDLFSHLTFGLLDGWWNYEDKSLRIPGSPGLYTSTWVEVLEKQGFSSTIFTADKFPNLRQQIIVAENITSKSSTLNKDHEKKKPNIMAKSNGVAHERASNDKRDVQKEYNFSTKITEVKFRQNEISIDSTITDQAVLDHVESHLIEFIAESLQIEKSEIEPDISLADYGVDSIVAIGLVKKINKALGITLQTTALFDYSCITLLANYIVDKFYTTVAAALNSVQPQESSVMGGSSSSDDDAYLTNKGGIDIENYKSDQNSVDRDGEYVFDKATARETNELKSHVLGVLPSATAAAARQETIQAKKQMDIAIIGLSGKFSEATYMDPQQRLFLEAAWVALEDAGCAGDRIKRYRSGVYVGVGAGDYDRLFSGEVPEQAFWGNAASVLPARIAYYLDLKGPALAIDTACSSSLVAIHLACQALDNQEVDCVLAGGVFLQSTPSFYNACNNAGMLSSAGRCYTFDDRADGFVPGEGVGVLVLKRLNDALQDGDQIYGVIIGSAVNQDGATNGITAPSSNAQEALECQVYEKYSINPEHIQMVEAHGTGTKLGDPIEYEALTRAFRHYTDKKQYCAIGSIKTVVGHTAAAAGVSGVARILLSLRHQVISPSLHYKQGNSSIAFEESPFFVNSEPVNWTSAPNQRRLAAVSSFGFSGTNAHMVIAEAPAETRIASPKKEAYIIVLSARSKTALQQHVKQLVAFLEINAAIDIGNMSFSLLTGRAHFPNRLACVAGNSKQLIEQLRAWMNKGKAPGVLSAELSVKSIREQVAIREFGQECISDCCAMTEGKRYIEKLFAIAELYTQGYALNFAKLFTRQRYVRIFLPTYPFEKKT
ncbi:MAG: beta-ketoacyl synthase N-terminal-like domain-containing protein [Exilibacterium sp.]